LAALLGRRWPISRPKLKFGAGFALAALATLELLERSGHTVTAPGPLLLVVVVHACLSEGWVSGLVSAALTLAYAGVKMRSGILTNEQFWILALANLATVGLIAFVRQRQPRR
jgi:hypothetical protein